jgi:hypothetical protein
MHCSGISSTEFHRHEQHLILVKTPLFFSNSTQATSLMRRDNTQASMQSEKRQWPPARVRVDLARLSHHATQRRSKNPKMPEAAAGDSIRRFNLKQRLLDIDMNLGESTWPAPKKPECEPTPPGTASTHKEPRIKGSNITDGARGPAIR